MVWVQELPSRLISVYATPLPSPSSTELIRPVRVTVDVVTQPVLEPVDTLPIVGPVRSMPMNIVCDADSPESSYTVSLGFQVPSENPPDDHCHP